jgi:hypothetical protein
MCKKRSQRELAHRLAAPQLSADNADRRCAQKAGTAGRTTEGPMARADVTRTLEDEWQIKPHAPFCPFSKACSLLTSTMLALTTAAEMRDHQLVQRGNKD